MKRRWTVVKGVSHVALVFFFVHQKVRVHASGQSMCTIKVLVNHRLKGLSLPRDSVSRLTERLDMPLIVLTWQWNQTQNKHTSESIVTVDHCVF